MLNMIFCKVLLRLDFVDLRYFTCIIQSENDGECNTTPETSVSTDVQHNKCRQTQTKSTVKI